MADFLLSVKNEERQTNFPTEQASQFILEMIASFANGAILMQI